MTENGFKEILDDRIEGEYWKPTNIGTTIEGNILHFKEGIYGLQTRKMVILGMKHITPQPSPSPSSLEYMDVNVEQAVKHWEN